MIATHCLSFKYPSRFPLFSHCVPICKPHIFTKINFSTEISTWTKKNNKRPVKYEKRLYYSILCDTMRYRRICRLLCGDEVTHEVTPVTSYIADIISRRTSVIFLGLILLASQKKRGCGGRPLEKFFMKPHFFNSECSVE